MDSCSYPLPNFRIKPTGDGDVKMIKITPASADWIYIDFEYSDDEDDIEEGRISPCTFRLWAEGSQKWDTGDRLFEAPEEVRIYVTEALYCNADV